MTNVYCDASCDNERGISAWACLVITQKGKRHVYAGHYTALSSQCCEVRAVVKSIGKVKSMKGRIYIHTDFFPIVVAAADPVLRLNCDHKYGWDGIWNYLATLKPRLRIFYIPSAHNPAHALALAELRRLRQLD